MTPFLVAVHVLDVKLRYMNGHKDMTLLKFKIIPWKRIKFYIIKNN